MKLTLKQQWRPRPLNSFLGFVDIKLGVTLALLFAVLNKVAGVYGLIAVFTGGSFAQLSMYMYSVMMLVAFGWALKVVADEDARRTLYFAHLFFADHVLSTTWTVFFAVVWWVYTPHDGRRQANSEAQERLMKGALGYDMTPEERTAAAMQIWNKEKGLALEVIIFGWFIKFYFAALIYSYALHLRKGSYRSLPCSTPAPSSQYLDSRRADFPESVLGLGDEEDMTDDFYRVPLSSTSQQSNIAGKPLTVGHHPNSSITSFADFVTAPGRSKRSRAPGTGIIGKPGSLMKEKDAEMEDEVLFDSDELGPSRFGTDDTMSASSSSRDDETSTNGRWSPLKSRV